jgi:hypothetical protein
MANHLNRRVSDYAPGSNAADVLKAALAGATAVWVMGRFDWFASNHEDSQHDKYGPRDETVDKLYVSRVLTIAQN